MSSKPLEPGTRIGKYEVQAHVATGGMGTVYKALDLKLRRTVALKVLPQLLAQRDSLLERFRREARHAARLNHKHIVALYEDGYDEEKDLYYLALEFIEGIDLGAHIGRKGQLPPEEARRILIQAAKALEYAHSQGVIHRDVKPANFLLARVGTKVVVKLTDLGLAMTADEDEFKVTRDGSTVGTVDYLSPEQARDSRGADIRSDIYSLGCTAYHMLAGKPPFAEGGLGERVYKHMETPPTDVRQFSPTVSAGFWAVVRKMLAKKPEDRYATPGELAYALTHTPATASEVPPAPSPPISQRKTDHLANAPTSTALPATPRRPSPPPELMSTGFTPPLVTLEQARTAAKFHEKVLQVLAEGGGIEYAREMLANCLKLDPFTPAYRKTLRDLNRKAGGSVLGRWFGSLNALAIKAKMRAARAGGDWRKVLELGEDVLARQPADADTHVELAEAARELDLPDLRMWFLEQGLEQSPDHPSLLGAVALIHEQRKEWQQAIALWEKVRELRPDDPEAQRKITALSVNDHLKRTLRRR